MTPRQIQYAIAAVFFVLGGWCLVAPQSVIDVTPNPAYRPHDEIAPLLVACFGAQACIAGLFAALSVFTKRTFLAYGIAVLPFFAFDWWFYAVKPVFNGFLVLDAIGNAIFVVLCWLGWRGSR